MQTMLAFRRILFLIGATSAHADLCTSTNDDNMDLSSMLQAAVTQHGRPSMRVVEADATQILLKSVTDVAKSLTNSSSSTVTPEAVETAISVAASAVSSMLPTLNAEHEAGQREVDRQFGEIVACGNHAAHGVLATSQNADSLQTEEDALDQCHQELVTAQQEQTRACDAWTHLVNSLSDTRPACGHPSTEEQFYDNFQTWKGWINDQDSGIESRRTACIDARIAVSTKEGQCASQAADYETAFCQHRLTCGLLSACQAHETQVYEDLLVDIRVAVSSSQGQYRAIQQIQCVLALITPAIQTGTAIAAEELDACHGDSDASHLMISFGTLPELEECPTPTNYDPVCPELAEVSEVNEWTNGAISQVAQPFSEGLLAYYDMTTDGNTLIDASGNNMDGTVESTNAVSDGFSGDALDFSSQQSLAILPAGTCVQGANPRTVAFWYRSTASGWFYVFSWGQDGNNCNARGSFNARFADGYPGFMGCGADYDPQSGIQRVNDGSWHHVAYTYQDGVLTNFVDGAQNWQVHKQLTTNCAVSLISSHNDRSSVDSAGGDVDEFRVYSYAMTTEEISELANYVQ